MKPGQDLVIVGYAGLCGTRILAREKRKELEQWFSEDYLDSISDNQMNHFDHIWKNQVNPGVTECEPVGIGGVLTALWNLSAAHETGLEFSLRKIPVRQETIEICERFELNPYRLYSDNCYLLVTDNGGQLTERLDREGIAAATIGKVNSTIAREILSAEGRGFLERPQPDELEKVIPGCDFISNQTGDN